MEWMVVAERLRFPEGPVQLPDGDIAVVEIEAGIISRIDAAGSRTEMAKPGGGPNGLAMGPDGKLYCCNNGGFTWIEHGGRLIPRVQPDDYSGGRIERIDLRTGEVELLYRSGDFGCRLNGPNDIVFDREGGFWFSDYGKTRDRDRDRGAILYARADGSDLREVVFPVDNPNGIGLSPDGRTLYVAETFTCRLTAYDVVEPGKIAEKGPLGMSGTPLYRPAGWKFFDSLGVEACGNICVATIGEPGITVISPTGSEVEFVPCADEYTTNICWGGADLMDAYVTQSATGRLIKGRWPRPGLALAY